MRLPRPPVPPLPGFRLPQSWRRVSWHHLYAAVRARLATRTAAVVAAVVLLPGIAAAAVLVPSASARSTHPTPQRSSQSLTLAPEPVVREPTPDPAVFAAAARRPAPSAPIAKLPHVDLGSVAVGGIPPRALAAYRAAAGAIARSDAGCRIPWWLIAGIGFVESGHAHAGGSGRPGWNGIASPPIYGPVLDGHGFAAIRDTDHGRLDGNTQWDRAVGPMQFLPSSWRTWGTVSGRMQNPQDIRAAALATGRYLCASGGNLSQPTAMAAAVYSYNHSFDYVRLVLSVAAKYAHLSPAALGVDALPHDKPAKKPHKARPKKKPAARRSARPATTRGSSGASASPRSGSSRSPAPAPTATSAAPTPAPTDTATLPVPLPSG